MYERMLPASFQYRMRGEPDEIRALVLKLLEPPADDEPEPLPFGGTSFAVTVRPDWTLWLSDASRRRLGWRLDRDPGVEPAWPDGEPVDGP